jgi:hypothetical protein
VMWLLAIAVVMRSQHAATRRRTDVCSSGA